MGVSSIASTHGFKSNEAELPHDVVALMSVSVMLKIEGNSM